MADGIALQKDIAIGADIASLDTPAHLVDLDVLERNIQAMAAFAAASGVALRPHAKSHKTAAIARRQLAAGATGLTVAKLDEAEAYLDAGVADLFVANEVVGAQKWARLAAMQRRGRVAAGVDDPDVAGAIAAAARAAGVTIPLLVEVDSGLGRAGVLPGEAAAALAEHVARLEGLELAGVFTHAGHAYAAGSPEELRRIALGEAEAVVRSAALIRGRGLPCPTVSVGATPTVRVAGAVPGVTEIRPGNYVFFDRMQVALGSATPDDCSLTVLATVISAPPPDRAVIDAGSKSFALDRGAHGNEGLAGFGAERTRGLVLDRLSEEHGMLRGAAGVRPGERLRFIPNHACTAANLARRLIGVRGDRVHELLDIIAPGGGR